MMRFACYCRLACDICSERACIVLVGSLLMYSFKVPLGEGFLVYHNALLKDCTDRKSRDNTVNIVSSHASTVDVNFHGERGLQEMCKCLVSECASV